MQWLGITLAFLLILIGLVGTVVPLLPGAPLIFVGFLVYGIFNGFAELGLSFWLGQIVLVLLVLLIDYIAGAVGTKKFGGSKAGVWGSIIGGIVGLVFLPPIGLLLGTFLGAVIGELFNKRSLQQAIKIGIGSFVGLAGGLFGKIIFELVMVVWFIIAIF